MNDNRNYNIDLQRVHAQRRAHEAELRELKACLRSPWGSEPMGSTQRRALALAYALTGLYALIAWSRGRSHLADAEYSRELAQALEPRFTRRRPVAHEVRHGLG